MRFQPDFSKQYSWQKFQPNHYSRRLQWATLAMGNSEGNGQDF